MDFLVANPINTQPKSFASSFSFFSSQLPPALAGGKQKNLYLLAIKKYEIINFNTLNIKICLQFYFLFPSP